MLSPLLFMEFIRMPAVEHLWGGPEMAFSRPDWHDVVFDSYVQHLPSLHRYLVSQCRKLGAPESLASDFAQETFRIAIEEMDGEADHPVSDLPWLKKVGVNLVIDWLRTNCRMISTDNIETVDERDGAIAVEEAEELEKFFRWLTEDERELLELIYMKDMTVAAAGAMIGMGRWQAYKAHKRALARLHELLTEHGTRGVSQGSAQRHDPSK